MPQFSQFCRRSFLLGAASAMGAFAGARTSLAATEPAVIHRVTLALGARNSLYHLPLTLAEQLGYFRQAGLAVEWQMHESGGKAVTSAIQGHADVVAGAFEHVLALQNKGQPYQAFVQFARTPLVALGVSTRRALNSVIELKGARVGVSGLDSSTHWMACQWLLQNGLLPEDVTFVEVGSSMQAADALRAGLIDALSNPDPLMYWLEQKNELRLLGEARSLQASRKVMGGAVPGACLFAHTGFLQRQPAAAQALADGVVHAIKWLQTAGLTDVLKVVPSHHWLGDRAIYLGAFEKLREAYGVDGAIVREAVANAAQMFGRLPWSQASVRLPLSSTYTNALVSKSRQRFDV